jgi:predicted nucleic acid-binding protein
MSFLLDTNVVSEWVKPSPNPGVVAWLADVDEAQVFLTLVTRNTSHFQRTVKAGGADIGL